MQNLEANIIIVGLTGVGKTSLVRRLVQRTFLENEATTFGANHSDFDMEVDDYEVKLRLCDLSGQAHFKTLAPHYIRLATAAMVVYDITSMASFQEVYNWVTELKGSLKNAPSVFCVVGNKVDLDHPKKPHPERYKKTTDLDTDEKVEPDSLENTDLDGHNITHLDSPRQADMGVPRQVSRDDGALYAKSNEALFFEISAKEDINVTEAFECISRELVKMYQKNPNLYNVKACPSRASLIDQTSKLPLSDDSPDQPTTTSKCNMSPCCYNCTVV